MQCTEVQLNVRPGKKDLKSEVPSVHRCLVAELELEIEFICETGLSSAHEPGSNLETMVRVWLR